MKDLIITPAEIRELIKAGLGKPRKLTINLSVARVNHAFMMTGTQFAVWSAPLATDSIQVRFNESTADAITFVRGQSITCPFDKVFITNAALAGNMDIIYGTGAIDLFQATVETEAAGTGAITTSLAAILAAIQGGVAAGTFGQTVVGLAFVQISAAAAARVGGIIQAPSTNAGNFIYLGFDNTVAANNCFAELAAGDSWSVDDYRGPIYAIASAAAQTVDWGLW